MPEFASRPPVCADDRWYPSQLDELQQAVNGYIQDAQDLNLPGEVIGLVVPHAGYYFSAHVAGAGYRQIQGHSYDTVVLIGPDHSGVGMGGQVVPDYDFWRTPLGEVGVDRAMVSDLESHVPLRWVRRDSEHSLEVQLPFLQTVLGDFSLVPIIMGDASLNACRSLGSAIADVVQDRQVLLVASTDLSHFHPDATARTLDKKTLQYMLDYDPQGLVRALGTGEAHACGGGPVAAVMFAAQQLGAGRAQLVKYATSGDVWDDRSRVVGYAAVALMC